MSKLTAAITAVGGYVPQFVMTNQMLEEMVETNDEWITERTGIKERRWIDTSKKVESTSSMALEASKTAIADAGIDKNDIDFIVFATLSPDYYFPGPGVTLQKDLGLDTIGALDVRNQCSGFVYALSVADQYIKTGMYNNILVVGAEYHSGGLDKSTKGRGVTVIFGDGAGACVLTREEDSTKGILSTHLHSEGKYADKLIVEAPSIKHWVPDILESEEEDGSYFPYMDGTFVFKHAVVRFSEVIMEGLIKNGLSKDDIDMLIPHQANLRIAQFIQKKFGLADDKVFNNIMKYGNTTAASVIIALTEAWEEDKIKAGDNVVLAAFGSGFTWGSVIVKW